MPACRSIGLCGCVLALLLAPPARAECAGVELPNQVEDFGGALLQNGVGLREATFLEVDVYVAGL